MLACSPHHAHAGNYTRSNPCCSTSVASSLRFLFVLTDIDDLRNFVLTWWFFLCSNVRLSPYHVQFKINEEKIMMTISIIRSRWYTISSYFTQVRKIYLYFQFTSSSAFLLVLLLLIFSIRSLVASSLDRKRTQYFSTPLVVKASFIKLIM